LVALGDISLTALNYPPPGRMFAAGQTLRQA
jgi:microcystin-dependent protein